MKVHIPEDNSFFYPDALVICEKPLFYSNRKDVIINPLVIVKVLSTSTEDYDRGTKFDKYSSIDSFKEYILIHQSRYEITSFFREESDLWRKTTFRGLDAELYIKALLLSVEIKEIYDGVEL
jgi:Uma2 family endonuclease